MSSYITVYTILVRYSIYYVVNIGYYVTQKLGAATGLLSQNFLLKLGVVPKGVNAPLWKQAYVVLEGN